MRILIVGSGGREHALGWRLAREGHDITSAPGNPGLARHGPCLPVAAGDRSGIVALARTLAAELVVIGPEAPLAEGLSDALRAEGLAAFGPSRAAARLESSKVFAKELMAGRGVPTAACEVAEDVEGALAAARRIGFPCVLKADGLAAGKGVVVAQDAEEARRFAFECLISRRFGVAGSRLVVEAFLAGEEASLFFLSDGRETRAFPAARDYKRLEAGDRGPNTGGMGAFAPAPLSDAVRRAVESRIVTPVLEGLAAAGAPFCGLLYAGLMVTSEGPQVLEFNVRFGDPETQVLLPLVEGELGALLLECARGALRSPLSVRPEASVGVVLASPGYPDAPATGGEIRGLLDWPAPSLEEQDELWCFHAGTRVEEGRAVAAGGRVVTVVACAGDRATARRRAYVGLARLELKGGQWRNDVAADPVLVADRP